MLRVFNYTFCLVLLVCLLPLRAIANNVTDDEDGKSLTKCQIAEQEVLFSSDLAEASISKHFKLLGRAKFSVLFWDIYESALFTSDGQRPLSTPCQHSMFEIQYLRDISKKELLENTKAQWQHLSVENNVYQPYLQILDSIWPDIKAGDQLTLLNKGAITVFYFNQKKLGAIESNTFAHLFLSIWLDKNTTEPLLRQQLLGELI
jgi:hypothetical protein